MMLLLLYYRITLHIPHDEAGASPQQAILEGVKPAPGVGPEANRRGGLIHGRLVHGGVHDPPPPRPAHRQTPQLYVPLDLLSDAWAKVPAAGRQVDPPPGGAAAL